MFLFFAGGPGPERAAGGRLAARPAAWEAFGQAVHHDAELSIFGRGPKGPGPGTQLAIWALGWAKDQGSGPGTQLAPRDPNTKPLHLASQKPKFKASGCWGALSSQGGTRPGGPYGPFKFV